MANKLVDYEDIINVYSSKYTKQMALTRCQQNLVQTKKRITDGQDGNLETWEKVEKYFKKQYILEKIEKLQQELKELN